jgi:hypothetical protein
MIIMDQRAFYYHPKERTNNRRRFLSVHLPNVKHWHNHIRPGDSSHNDEDSEEYSKIAFGSNLADTISVGRRGIVMGSLL